MGTIPPRVSTKDKPYRVYRAGRARGRAGPPEPEPRRGRKQPSKTPPSPPSRPRWRGRGLRLALIGALLLCLLLLLWLALGYLAFRNGIAAANGRLDPQARAALDPHDGLLLSSPSTVLVLGVDRGPGRTGPGRADAIMLARLDPERHTVAFLSIPRDLRVEIPGYGAEKINAAYANGAAALSIRTVELLTGLPIHHVAVVDFDSFASVIDTLGGVTLDVSKPIVSSRFDCPYSSPLECGGWSGWRFAKGRQRMDGERALVYARIRTNRLDPSESDVTRGEHQQQLVEAVADEIVSLGSYLRLPFIGDELVRPLATSLSASDLIQLAWVKFRTPPSRLLRCRLGGRAEQIGDSSYIVGDEENSAVIAMVQGEAAPQPPLPGSGPFGPGCRTAR